MCECPICYGPVEASTTGKVELSCGHTFHMACVSKWFYSNAESSCPMCRKNITDLENVHKPVVQEDEDDEDEPASWRLGDTLLAVESNILVQMFALIGGTIQPGFEQCLGALYGEDSAIDNYHFNRIGSKIGCRYVDSVEWMRITVRQGPSCIEALAIYDMRNNNANTAYDDVCNSLIDDRIPFTLTAAEERLEDWIEDPTLPGAKPELIESYRLVLDTWRGHFGTASPLEDLLAEPCPPIESLD